MKMNKKLLTLIALVFGFQISNAMINPEKLQKMKDKVQLAGARMDCQPAQMQIDMEINNVRARLLKYQHYLLEVFGLGEWILMEI